MLIEYERLLVQSIFQLNRLTYERSNKSERQQNKKYTECFNKSQVIHTLALLSKSCVAILSSRTNVLLFPMLISFSFGTQIEEDKEDWYLVPFNRRKWKKSNGFCHLRIKIYRVKSSLYLCLAMNRVDLVVIDKKWS